MRAKISLASSSRDLLQPLIDNSPLVDWQAVWSSPLGVWIEVYPRKRKRSLDQNARYWAIVSAIANHAGYTPEEMHEEVLCGHFGYDLVRFRGGERKRPNRRSSQLTTAEFGELMALAEQWAVEEGVAWEEVA